MRNTNRFFCVLAAISFPAAVFSQAGDNVRLAEFIAPASDRDPIMTPSDRVIVSPAPEDHSLALPPLSRVGEVQLTGDVSLGGDMRNTETQVGSLEQIPFYADDHRVDVIASREVSPRSWHDRGGWVRGELLNWWTSGLELPPLVAETPVGVRPNLGQPQAVVLFGGDDTTFDDNRLGVRLHAGIWLDDCQCCALQADWWWLESEALGFCDHSDGRDRSTGRPFVNLLNGQLATQLVAFFDGPGGQGRDLSGSVHVDVDSRIYGGGVGFRRLIRACGDDCSATTSYVLAGWRHMRLDESLRIREDLLMEEPLAGQTIDVMDAFDTDNRFHGGELGFAWEYECSRLSVELLTRIALGSTRQLVNIAGSTVSNTPGNIPPGRQQFIGGLLALDSNIGRHSRNVFSAVPELALNLGYVIHERVRASVGYSLIYWSHVVRPGREIDPVINPDLIPGDVQNLASVPRRPGVRFNDTGLWLQGLNLGIEVAW